jgi:hypothetical protein
MRISTHRKPRMMCLRRRRPFILPAYGNTVAGRALWFSRTCRGPTGESHEAGHVASPLTCLTPRHFAYHCRNLRLILYAVIPDCATSRAMGA